jgi:hypothetical protein
MIPPHPSVSTPMQVFCLEHRKYAAHSCPRASDKANTNFVLLCPLCAKSVRLVADQTPDEILKSHHSSGSCDPSHYKKVYKKPRCPVKGCKEILTFSNKVRCKDCHVDVCLRHRYAAEHKCERAHGGGVNKGPGLKLIEKLATRGAQGCAQELAKEKGGLKGGSKGSNGKLGLFNMWSY